MKRALLLEDSLTAMAAARAALQRSGYAVVHCRSVKAAKAASLSRFDVYIIDASVWATALGGEGNGLSFARWLRALRPAAAVVVWTSGDHRAEAEAIGARFVSKDGGIEALLAAL